MGKVYYETMARERVRETPELEHYEAALFYDWNKWHEHMQWVATAPLDVIIDWCEELYEDASLVAEIEVY